MFIIPEHRSGLITFREFRLLLEYIVFYNDLWERFDEIDADGDHRVTLDEFKAGIKVRAWSEQTA